MMQNCRLLVQPIPVYSSLSYTLHLKNKLKNLHLKLQQTANAETLITQRQ